MAAPLPGAAAVASGRTAVWPLPLDTTCASAARRVFREAVASLRLPSDLAADGVTMASELAANTLHAQDNVESSGPGQWAVAGGPEVWLYLRRPAGRWELVCKVFDSLPGWRDGQVPDPDATRPDAVAGRGLQIVAALSGGHWGHHLTRARLGGWKVPGKAVWFALPMPDGAVPGQLRRVRLGPCDATRVLQEMLAGRGLAASMLRIDEPGAAMSVLSVRCGLTVWCRGGVLSWRSRGGHYERRLLTDLEDAAEQLVRICEEMEQGTAPGLSGPGGCR